MVKIESKDLSSLIETQINDRENDYNIFRDSQGLKFVPFCEWVEVYSPDEEIE